VFQAVGVHDTEAVVVGQRGIEIIRGVAAEELPLSAASFYREATLRTAEEVIAQMRAAGFDEFRCCQTIFHEAATVTAAEPVNEGYGDGLFVIQARRA
jgi:hypothetical protein